MAGFNPISYHVGSVWPHDTALACEGLRRYGLDGPALRPRRRSDGRAGARSRTGCPSCSAATTAGRRDVPVPYPPPAGPRPGRPGCRSSSSRLFLGLEPDIPNGRIGLRPALPRDLDVLELRDVSFPSGRLSVRLDQAGTEVLEAPGRVNVEIVNVPPTVVPAGAWPVRPGARDDRDALKPPLEDQHMTGGRRPDPEVLCDLGVGGVATSSATRGGPQTHAPRGQPTRGRSACSGVKGEAASTIPKPGVAGPPAGGIRALYDDLQANGPGGSRRMGRSSITTPAPGVGQRFPGHLHPPAPSVTTWASTTTTTPD